MTPPPVTRLSLIRHAPPQDDGRLAGRRDVAAHPGDPAQITALRGLLGAPDVLIASPALRCRQTSGMIWADAAPLLEPDLWEQDFGDWEDTPYADLPDIGALTTRELAGHRPPNGESFSDLCARIQPKLHAISRNHANSHIAVVCHAGVIRAALAWALELDHAALGFAVAPLSLTQIDIAPGGARVSRVNWTVA